MLIGTMNHPARPVLKEIEWMAELGFEFVDLTLDGLDHGWHLPRAF